VRFRTPYRILIGVLDCFEFSHLRSDCSLS
jgi:hypothetical protein